MPGLNVRPFQTSDASSVIEIWRTCLPSSHPWNEPVSVICSKQNRADELFFVGEREGKLIATVMAGYDGVRGWIYSLAVVEDYRNRGYGRQMLRFAEKSLLARGCRKVGLQVRESNLATIGFYERCGFQQENRASLAKVLPTVDILDPVPCINLDGFIELAQMTPCDEPALLRHLNETDAFYRNTVSIPFPYSELDAKTWIAKVRRESMDVDRSRNWAIRVADEVEESKMIGSVGLFNIQSSQHAEIGYWLARPFWRQGIATQVVNAVCQYAFDEMKLHRVWAKVLSGNPASARVLEKSGFRLEGVLRSHFAREGTVSDVKCFGRLKTDTVVPGTPD